MNTSNFDEEFERAWKVILEREGLAQRLAQVQILLRPWIIWPTSALLLWDGCVRMPEPYVYPDLLIRRLPTGIAVDRRMNNGPGRTAFHAGGGTCPHGWHCHHIYDRWYCGWPREGRPLIGGAVANGRHFTQSAGIVALHPDVNRTAHGDTGVVCFLRLFAFRRFGYDPEQRFSNGIDEYGFVPGSRHDVLYE